MADPATASARLAVLGSPIAHSKSPAIHAAAYRMLGLDWSYDAVEVGAGGLAAFVDGLGSTWRGLSLTMPLKREALTLSATTSATVEETGQANTVLFETDAARLFNTDVQGIVGALRTVDVSAGDTATVLGGGATAESAVVALRRLGLAPRVAVRSPERAARLASVAPVIRMTDAVLDDAVVISTLPPSAEFSVELPVSTARSVLLDVAYDPWPSRLGSAWAAAGGTVVNGLEMLLFQALIQVRIFVGGDDDAPLRDEPGILRAMRAAVEGS